MSVAHLLCGTVHLSDGGKTVRCIKVLGHVGPHCGPADRPLPAPEGRPAVRRTEPLVRIQLADRLYLVCPESRQPFVQTILTGSRYPAWVAERIASGAVKRVLDVGCGEGAFAAFCWSVNPRVWVDGVEPDEALRKLALLNAPPGTVVTDGLEGVHAPRWDLIRWGLSCPVPGAGIGASAEIFDFAWSRGGAAGQSAGRRPAYGAP